uniref:lipoate protein ligase C-terminal domain-containing protein n=1 Tax=Staphylococcus pettenkoferi TaxID=170573 RepID=UPI0023EE6AA9
KVDVGRGGIANGKMLGELLGEGEVSEIEEGVVGRLEDLKSIKEAVWEYSILDYLGDTKRDELIGLMCYAIIKGRRV